MEQQNRFSDKKKRFNKSKRDGNNPEDEKKKFTYRGPDPLVGHLPGPTCKKSLHVFRSMIRWQHTNRYRKDIPVPLNGYGDKDATKWTETKTKNGVVIKVPPVNQLWTRMVQTIDGSKPKKRVRNVRMPEPKPTGKKR